MDRPTVRLPWLAEKDWNEDSFNNTLGWLLQAEPELVRGLSENVGLAVDPAFDNDVVVRRGETGGGIPDLMLTGQTWDSSRRRWRRARVIIEVKTSIDHPLSGYQRGRYKAHRRSFQKDSVVFLLVVPPGYVARHKKDIPTKRTMVMTHVELRNVLLRSSGSRTTRLLIDEAWRHRFDVQIELASVPGRLDDPADGELDQLLQGLLLRVREHVSGLVVHKLGSSKTRASRYRGFNMYYEGEGKPRYAGWVGFTVHEGKPKFQVDTSSADVIAYAEKRLPGETTQWDEGSAAGTWWPVHLEGALSTVQIWDQGGRDLLERMGADQS